MSYSRWATIEEIQNNTTKVTMDSDVKASGVTIMYDDEAAYIDSREVHNMIIGCTGSGKTQTTILPQLYLSIRAGESFIINDIRGEIYKELSGLAKENGYKVEVLNCLDMSKGNNYNPFMLPYKYYKEGNIDLAVEEVENIAYYIMADKELKNVDPFWEESAIGLFTGLSFYLFENAKPEEININSVYNLSYNSDKLSEELDKMDKSSVIYSYLTPILKAPKDTKGSIISVFQQKMGLLTTREAVSKLLCNNNLDLENVKNEKTAIFVIGDGRYSSIIFPIIVDQLFNNIKSKNLSQRRLNVVIDEFESLKPIKNFVSLLDHSRGLNIRFTIVIKSYLHLENTYGSTNSEFVRMAIGNVIYLLANDIKTLEIISRDCGKIDNNNELISIEDLKVLRPFEAIVLMNRMYPIRTKLLPYFELHLKEIPPVELKPLEFNEVKLYK